MRQILSALLGILAAIPVVVSILPAEESAAYHHYTIAQIDATNPADWKNLALSHVSVDGWVVYKKHEADGDWHLRLCDAQKYEKLNSRCIVAEIIPQIPLPVPAFRAHITVQGIARYDAENPGHHWWEVHPVEKWELVK